MEEDLIDYVGRQALLASQAKPDLQTTTVIHMNLIQAMRY